VHGEIGLVKNTAVSDYKFEEYALLQGITSVKNVLNCLELLLHSQLHVGIILSK